MATIKCATEAWSRLNGIFCVFKPYDVKMHQIGKVISTNLSRDLNRLKQPEKKTYVSIEGKVGESLEVIEKVNYAHHKLVLGPAYQDQDWKIMWPHTLDKIISGVCVMGVNNYPKLTYRIEHANLIRTYHLSGKFGYSTDDLFHTGKVIEKSYYKHVTTGKIHRLLMTIQAAHQRRSVDFLKLDPHSQEAYEALAETGLVRPGKTSSPLIYALKLVNFKPPEFVVEAACINETPMYLLNLIHDIGLKLKSNTVCSGVRCIRYGKWDLSHALLSKDWTAENIIQSIDLSLPIVTGIVPTTPSLMPLESQEDPHQMNNTEKVETTEG